VVGRNGVGKTTLLRICLGQREADEGKVTIGKRVVFNYIDQNRMQLVGSNTVIQEVEDSDGVVYFGGQSLSIRSDLRRFLFTDERVNERVDLLSGGERARVMLAKVLKRGGNVLVLDEPTNDLDLGSLRMLEEALLHFGGSVLVVSHDRYFLDRICDQVVAFEDGGAVVQPGNYSYYLEKKLQRNVSAQSAFAPVVSVKTKPPAARNEAVRPKKLSFKEQRELAGMEEAILVAEAKAAELEALLNDPEFYVKRASDAAGISSELEAAKAEVAKLYARWAELEAVTG
jgi:ATP-binding cassette subfamily F protein uup